MRIGILLSPRSSRALVLSTMAPMNTRAGWMAMAVLALLAGCSTAPERGGRGFEEPGDAPAISPGAEIGRGKASWYGPGFHGRRTASGERFDMNDLTAAHRTLPLGTRVRVRNIQNGLEVVVRINDRGPRFRSRIIDLSKAAAAALDLLQAGEALVVLTATDDSSSR
jgi:rare lipoprotein A